MKTLSSSDNPNNIFTEDGKGFKFCSRTQLARYFGINYNKMRDIIKRVLGKKDPDLLTPKETKKVYEYLNS